MNNTQKKPQVNVHKANAQMIATLRNVLSQNNLSNQSRQEIIEAIAALTKIGKYF